MAHIHRPVEAALQVFGIAELPLFNRGRCPLVVPGFGHAMPIDCQVEPQVNRRVCPFLWRNHIKTGPIANKLDLRAG